MTTVTAIAPLMIPMITPWTNLMRAPSTLASDYGTDSAIVRARNVFSQSMNPV